MISMEKKLQSQIEDLKRRVRDIERAIGRANLGAVGDVFPWDKIDFGYVISGLTFTANAGRVFWPTANDICLPKTYDFSGESDGDYFISVNINKYTAGGTEASYADLTLIEPVSGGDYIRIWKYVVTKSGNSLSVSRYGHFGNIYIFGAFAL